MFVQISTADETSFCGRITKQWSGLAKEAFTDADNYGISFPIDLDINIKAILMGAVFLIVSNAQWAIILGVSNAQWTIILGVSNAQWAIILGVCNAQLAIILGVCNAQWAIILGVSNAQ